MTNIPENGVFLGWSHPARRIAHESCSFRGGTSQQGGQQVKLEPAWSLEEINQYLRQRNLPGFKHLGVERGGWTLRRLIGCQQNSHVAHVEFEVISPDDVLASYRMKMNPIGPTNALIVMVEDHLVFVRQHRATLMTHSDIRRSWTTEIPREGSAKDGTPAFVDRLLRSHWPDQADPNAKKTAGILGRELGPLIPLFQNGTLTFKEHTYLGDFPEDSGTSTVFVDCHLVELATSNLAAVLATRGTRIMGIRVHSLADVRKQRRALGITDAHSATALLYLYEHLGIV